MMIVAAIFNKIYDFLGEICLKSAYLIPVLLLFLQQTAHADVYGFIDDKGIAHFAAERVDARYELFFKGGESFDTQQGLASKSDSKNAINAGNAVATNTNVASSAAKDKANSKIQAYFDVSTNFKAVRHHMRDAAKTYNVDFELLQAMIVAESGFDHLAVSPKGAIGLMQLMPDTAKRFGVNADKSKSVELKLRDPKTNINAGAKYLRTLINMFPGKLELAIASYNAGEGAVQKFGNKIPPYKETQNYVSTVIQTYLALKPPVVITSLRNASAVENAPNRVRMQMGGAIGRGNMVSPIASADSATVQN
jgi:soluble lytic murein transglycosylase-like protein